MVKAIREFESLQLRHLISLPFYFESRQDICMSKFFPLVVIVLFTNCAFVHKHQVQNVDARILKPQAEKFQFMMSETGVELAEGVKLASVFAKDSATRKAGDNIAGLIGLIQMGPRTGNPIYSLSFADGVTNKISKACQGGEITGLTFLRETNKYPVVSGEIIKVTGYCLKRK
jgi:hypothetical protein